MRMFAAATLFLAVVCLGAPMPVRADKRLFSDAFTPAEFAARRSRVMSAIGDGVAILSGAADTPTYTKFRQNAQFFYLSGVEVPRAILVIDGRTKSSTLFLPPHGSLERSEGPLLGPDEQAKHLTGIDVVADRSVFANVMKTVAAADRAIYMPFRGESLGAASSDRIRSSAMASERDPWDGRQTKEQVFIEKVRAVAPRSEIRDLDPILDQMRTIKSTAEIAAIREATRIACIGILEAMKSARPGMREYELEAVADYFFKKYNAQGPAYFALVATGANAAWPHYHQAQAELADGDLVLMDYAPDYQYYTSDITRMFPANGTFSPRQRELYGIYLELYKAILTSIRPGPVSEGRAAAHGKMTAILASFPFTDPKIREAATRFVARYAGPGTSWGHGIGMEVHDVSGGSRDGIMKPGMVFTIEPALTIADERIYIRLEDAIVITATGIDHLSSALPMEIGEIERVMREPGLADSWKGAPAALERVKR